MNGTETIKLVALGAAVLIGLVADSHAQGRPPVRAHTATEAQKLSLAPATVKYRGAASQLIGYAADGFPIYALTAELDGAVKQIKSSYQLKSGRRPGGSGPTGAYDGAFVQDYEYRAGSGHLDACNGMEVQTAEYPDGTYAYFLTESFPVVPRCLMGKADRSFLRS